MTAAVIGNAETLSAGNSVSQTIKRTHGLLRHFLDRAFEHQGATFSQWIVLMCLKDGRVRTAADLSRAIEQDSGSLTRLLDQLEQRKLLKRCGNAVDRRVHDLLLTPEGSALLDALTPALIGVYNEVLSELSYADVEALLRLLNKLIAGSKSLAAARSVTVRRVEP